VSVMELLTDVFDLMVDYTCFFGCVWFGNKQVIIALRGRIQRML